MKPSTNVPTICLCAAALLWAALPGTPAQAAETDPLDHVPANAIMAFGIADSADFSRKLGQLPLTRAIADYLTTSPLAATDDYRLMLLELKKAEARLGFPVSAEHLLGEVFSDALFYIAPGTAQSLDLEPATVLRLGVRDAEKARRLLGELDRINEQTVAAALEDETTGGRQDSGAENATDEPLYAFSSSEKIAGHTVSFYRSPIGDGSGNVIETFYGVIDDEMLFATERGTFAGLLQPDPDAARLGGRDQFTRLRAELPWQDADVRGWIDGEALTGAAAVAPAALYQTSRMALALKMREDTLMAYFADSADPGQVSPDIRAASLEGLGFIGPRALAASVSREFDPEIFYGLLEDLWRQLPMASGQFDGSPFDNLQKETGVSVHDDLVPALGNELFVALNEVRPPKGFMPIPEFDLLVGFKLRDREAMNRALGRIERSLENLASGKSSVRREFESTMVGETELRTLNLGTPQFMPGYAIHEDYLVLGPSRDALAAAVRRAGGKSPNLRASEGFTELVQSIGEEKHYAYTVLRLREMLQQVIKPFVLPLAATQAPNLPLTDINELIDRVLVHADRLESIKAVRSGIALNHLRFQMQ